MTLMNDDNFPNLSSIVDDIYHALKAPPPLLKTLIECCDYYTTMLPTIINMLPGDVRSFLLNFKTKDYGYQDESEERASIFSERQSENQTKSYLHHLLAFLYTMKCPILDRYLNHINSDKWVSVEDSYEYAFFSSIVYDLSREAPRRFGTKSPEQIPPNPTYHTEFLPMYTSKPHSKPHFSPQNLISLFLQSSTFGFIFCAIIYSLLFSQFRGVLI